MPGDPAPWFRARANTRSDFVFDTMAGRYIVLCFFGSAAHPLGRAAVDAASAEPGLCDDARVRFFGVSIDPADEAQKRVAGRRPGQWFFWDFDGRISRLYGAIPLAPPDKASVSVRQIWVVLDPTLRVLKIVPFANDGSDARELASYIRSLPPPSRFAGFEVQAPVLVLPNVFEAAFCERLIALYEAQGGEESGFMRQVHGKTVLQHDPGHKRRRDHIIQDKDVIDQAQLRFRRRVVPELRKAYQYHATRMERYIVGCYEAENGGHFFAHRDNTTKGTAHRRFAVSVNLNADFDGGELSFPEYGPKSFKPAPGCAVVFSCSLLHAVSKVSRGRRYAFLPFLYDDEAAKIREANNEFLGEGVNAYKG
jgi:peroxiredoxin